MSNVVILVGSMRRGGNTICLREDLQRAQLNTTASKLSQLLIIGLHRASAATLASHARGMRAATVTWT